MLNDLLNILAQNNRLEALATNSPVPNPAADQTRRRQNIWTGNEYNHPKQSMASDAADIVAGVATGDSDRTLTGRAELYARAGMNDRSIYEQMAGIANITQHADRTSQELLPRETDMQANVAPMQRDNTGGDVDTLRHTILAATLAQQKPLMGKLMLRAHENPEWLASNVRETRRDLTNNEQGWRLGENVPASDVDTASLRITNVMSNKTAVPYLPAQATQHRQSIWGR